MPIQQPIRGGGSNSQPSNKGTKESHDGESPGGKSNSGVKVDALGHMMVAVAVAGAVIVTNVVSR